MKRKILVVDDDRFFRSFCKDLLEKEEFQVREAQSVEQAEELLALDDYALVITDLVMPGSSGLDLLARVRETHPELAVIIVTGHATIETAVKAMKNGAIDYIRKPVNADEMGIVVHRAMNHKLLLEENCRLKDSLKLFDLTSRLSRTIEIDELYQAIFNTVMQETGSPQGLLYLLEQEDGATEVKLTAGFDLEDNRGIETRLYQACEEEIKDLYVPRAVSGAQSLEIKLAAGPAAVKSLLFIPLRSKRELVGMVVLMDTEGEGDFGEEAIGSLTFIVEHAQAALENALQYSHAKRLTITDDLTSVFNYRYLDNILDREILRSQRLGGAMSVLFMDLDNFKKVNDRFGHLVGSKILMEVAEILKESVRKVDVVARYGGDEYIVVLTDTASPGAMVVAERIRKSVEEHEFMVEEDMGIKLTASIGVSTYPEHARDKLELLRLADEAMYRGKYGRKNIVYLAVAGGNGEDRASARKATKGEQ